MRVKTRFAPSPTGFIHVGSAYSALLDYAFARKHRGEFFLRIEDTDKKRYVKETEEMIYKGLEWLGLKPDGELIRQSERLGIYKKYAEGLVEKGYAYYCFCSLERLEEIRQKKRKKSQPPMYDRLCRKINLKKAKERIAKGEGYVIRMIIPDNEKIVVNDLIRGEVVFDSDLIDDQILLKADGFPTYHLAAIVDDHLMKITHVIRGEEWLPSAPKHVLLYQYFGWKMPIFMHTPTLRNPDKSKLSKRKSHTSLGWYQEQGFLPEVLLNFLALLGWSHPEEKEIFSLDEFIRLFDLKDVSPIGPVFDLTKLEWMNGVYIRSKKNSELAELLKPFLPKMTPKQIAIAVPLIKERIKKLSEARDLLEFIWSCREPSRKLLLQRGLNKKQAKEMLKKTKEIISKVGIENTERLQKRLLQLIKENNWNTGAFFMLFRIAVTGKKITPPIIESLLLIGQEEVLKRLDSAVKKL